MSHSALLDRRGFLASGIGALVAQTPLGAAAAGAVCKVRPATPAADIRAEVVVSLREALKRAKPGARLSGLTRIDVVCRDDDNDILLCGVAEKGQPDLYLDDLVVAIRSADRKYGRIEPGISLDPDRSQTPHLDQISGRDAAAKQQYLRECSRQPQAVRVDALPRHSRVVKVLVDADYRMKQVVQGTLQLPIDPPLPGVFARRLDRSRQALRSGDAIDDWNGRRRFWFEPGKFEYDKDIHIASLRSTQVILSDAEGDAKAEAKDWNIDPVAREFACDWTARMDETIRAEPIWRDMYNIYRHFAIAHILQEEGFYSSEFRRLVDAHEIEHVELPDALPGLGRWETLEDVKGRRRVTLTSTICGGVSLGLASRMTSSYVVGAGSTTPTQMGLLRRAVALSRPEKTSVTWTVAPTALQAAAKWYEDEEQKRVEAERQSREDEAKRASDTKKGVGFLIGFVVVGCLVGWVMNRPKKPPAHLVLPEESSAPLVRPIDEPETTGSASPRRNEPCPCNSGKRFKHCHGAHATTG